MKRMLTILSVVALCLAIAPAYAFAETVVVEGSESYISDTNTWVDNNNQSADGKVDFVYDASSGHWKDPGADGPEGEATISRDNGTYIVTIPKLITYSSMDAGLVDVSASYTVNVRGAVASTNAVSLSVETANLSTSAGDSTITETATQGKRVWTAGDCYGSVNTDGSLSGTDCTDTLVLGGYAKAKGAYQGQVQYSTHLMNNEEFTAWKAQNIADTANSFAKHGIDGGLTWWIDESDGTLYYAPTNGISGVHGSGAQRTCYQYQDLVTRIVCLEGVNIGVESYSGVYLLGMYMTWPNLTTLDASRANVGTSWNFNQVEYAIKDKESLTIIMPPNQPAGTSHPWVSLSGNGSFKMTNPSTGIQYICQNGGTMMSFVNYQEGVFDNNTMVADGIWVITGYSTTNTPSN